MRLESDNYGTGMRGVGAADNFVEHGAMRAVDAIEVADGDDGRTEVGGDVGEFVKREHR